MQNVAPMDEENITQELQSSMRNLNGVGEKVIEFATKVTRALISFGKGVTF